MAEVKDNKSILTVAIKKKELLWNPIRLPTVFSTETLQAGREGKIYSKSWKEKSVSWILYPASSSFIKRIERKNFSDKAKTKETH